MPTTTTRRRWLGRAVVGVLSAGLTVVGPLAGTAPSQQIVIVYGIGGTPTITTPVPVDAATGDATVSWTMPAGHTSTNLHWNTEGSTQTQGEPTEGLPMVCWMTGPADGKHNCLGGRDQGNSTVSTVIRGLEPGTYHVQIQTYGTKSRTVNGNPGTASYNAFSPVVTFVVPPKPAPTTTTTTAAPARNAPPVANPGKPSASVDKPKLTPPPVGKDKAVPTKTVAVPAANCPNLEAGGFLNTAGAAFKALQSAAKGAAPARRAAIAAAIAKVHECNRTKAAADPKSAQQALGAVNNRKQEATTAKKAAAKADADADAKEATATAKEVAAKSDPAGPTGPAAADAAAARAAATEARKLADTKAKEAAAKQQAVTTAIGKCRRFTATKDRAITTKCK